MENNTQYTAETGKRYPGPVAAGLIFSITTILLTYGGGLLDAFKDNFLKSGMAEIFFILLPVIIILLMGRYDIKDTLKLKNTRPLNYLLVVFLMIFGMPVVGVLNAIVLGLIRLVFGKNLPIPQIAIPDVPTLFIAILVIGLSAAICEETMFRGFIGRSFSGFGTITSLTVTSILFGILHRDLQKGISTILLGALIGFIVYRTGSIFTGMVAHFTNNTIAVLLTYSASRMTKQLNGMGIDPFESLDLANIPRISLIFVIIFYLILFMGALSVFIGLFYAFLKSTKKDVSAALYSNSDKSGVPQARATMSAGAYICLAPGLILILLTFTGQILELMNVSGGTIYNILNAIGLR